MLVREVQRGTLTDRHGALDRAVAAVVLPQSDAFGSLFPPVWGCGFAGVFEPALEFKLAFRAQLAELAAGRRSRTRPSTKIRLHESDGGRGPAPREASRPARSARRRGIVRAVSRSLPKRLRSANEPAGRSIAPTLLGLGSGGSRQSSSRLVSTSFPVVFGMRYSALSNRMLVERSSLELAEHAAQAGNEGAAALALKQVAAQQAAIGSALRKQAARSAKAATSA